MSFKFVLSFLLLIPVLAWGGVNLKNGNFYITYTDLIVPGGGKKLEITRTYNSKVADVGWFGVGWGSDFETFLSVSADGSVVVHENGAGAQNRFVPRSNIDPRGAAQKIIAEIRKKKSLTASVAKEMEDKLSANAELRHAYARRYKVTATLAKGTTLYSMQLGSQSIEVTAQGYKRVFSDGRTETFNKDGKLTKISNKTGYYIDLSYNKNGKLENVKDSQAKQIFFDWYADGRVKEIWSVGDKKASYKYKDNDLIESQDVAGNAYKFGYDSNHNMTSVTYADKSQMQIKYGLKTQFTSAITDRNGEKTEYVYESNPKMPDKHYWTLVKKKGLSGKEVENRYEYEIKTRKDGSSYTYRILTIVDGLRTETVYSDKGSLPLKIVQGKNVTNFKYSDDGLLLEKKSSSGEYIKIDYEDKFKKISRVEKNKMWTEFQYDGRGNLTKASDSSGKSVLLVYDSKGRITKMVDKNSKDKKNQPRALSFKYNALGKPIEIKMEGAGVIRVDYDNYGEIKRVDSKSGPKIAIQVSQAFKNLLKVVQPAGVDLKMF